LAQRDAELRASPPCQHLCDLLVEECVLIELKAVTAFDEAHIAQCLNT